MSRVAAIDCGTNSIRLLIADVGERKLADVFREMRIVRLGQGVDRTGEFSQEALDRTFAACDEYAKLIEDCSVEKVRFVATSASRDVSNREAFVAGVKARLGIEPEIISGLEEAGLSFVGAISSLPSDVRHGSVLVVDIGGGSTELVRGQDGSMKIAKSVDIGCVRMTERWLKDDPPTPKQIAGAVADIDAAIALADSVVDIKQASILIGLAGSVTTVAGIAMGLREYDSQAIHASRISAARVTDTATSLLAQTREQRSRIPVMHPGRVDVIGGGALVLNRIMRFGGFDQVVVSEHDILDGIALAIAP